MSFKLPLVQEERAQFGVAFIFAVLAVAAGWAWWTDVGWLGSWSATVFGAISVITGLLTPLPLFGGLLVVSDKGVVNQTTFALIPIATERAPIQCYRLQWLSFGSGDDEPCYLYLAWRHLDVDTSRQIWGYNQLSDAQALAKLLGIELVIGDAEPDFSDLALASPPRHLVVKLGQEGLVIRTRMPWAVFLARTSAILFVALVVVSGLLPSVDAWLGEGFGLVAACWLGLTMVLFVGTKFFGSSQYTRKERVVCRSDVFRFRRRGLTWELEPATLEHVETLSLGMKKWWVPVKRPPEWEEFELVVETADERQQWFRSSDRDQVQWVAAALLAASEGKPVATN